MMKLLIALMGVALAQIVSAAEVAQALDPAGPGKYESGEWKYVLSIQSRGTRSEGRCGVLSYKNAELAAPFGSILKTPFGSLMFLGSTQIKGWGDHGWLRVRCGDRPVFMEEDKVAPDLKAEAKEVSLEAVLSASLSRGK